MKPILEVQHIGKKFRIQHLAGGYLSLRERLVNALKFQRNQEEDFWALKDVSFEVQAGESIGIIGRNGAGKSTLLKILSKITPPTTGRIISRGRIASLLEVGTGFHPELTGRENIFFNGSLLGMKRKEIERKFDEIVDFSGVEKFLDTPLKHFSSGMQLRLAFAVAAFLEPEILIIDEVLAVGDAEFQKKCLGKMEDVSKSGRTILFVSHNMGAIAQLCNKGILVERGNLIKQGITSEIIEVYLNRSGNIEERYKATSTQKEMVIAEAFLCQDNGNIANTFLHNENVSVVMKLLINNWVNGVELRLIFKDSKRKAIFTSDCKLSSDKSSMEKKMQVTASIPSYFLRPGSFLLSFALFIPHQTIIDLADNVLSLTVVDGGSKYAASEGLDYGYIFYEPKWVIN